MAKPLPRRANGYVHPVIHAETAKWLAGALKLSAAPRCLETVNSLKRALAAAKRGEPVDVPTAQQLAALSPDDRRVIARIYAFLAQYPASGKRLPSRLLLHRKVQSSHAHLQMVKGRGA